MNLPLFERNEEKQFIASVRKREREREENRSEWRRVNWERMWRVRNAMNDDGNAWIDDLRAFYYVTNYVVNETEVNPVESFVFGFWSANIFGYVRLAWANRQRHRDAITEYIDLNWIGTNWISIRLMKIQNNKLTFRSIKQLDIG